MARPRTIIRWERVQPITDPDSTHVDTRTEITHTEPPHGDGWELVEIPRGVYFEPIRREQW